MKISILTPSIRPEGLKVIQDCLKRQTLQDFEWLIEIGIPGKGHDLNAAFNRMLRRAKGELIVFYEDYTKILDDGLERFWKAYQEYPDTFFTAPLGKVDNWGSKPQWDWRSWKQKESQTDYTDCLPRCWEIDWGAAPKKSLFDVGGFDEELDKYWSGDNVSVAIRAEMKGYKFKCLFTNPAVAYDHDAHAPHPFRKDFNGSFLSDRCNAYRAGLTVDYLSSL
jgi:hypothetical protein